MNAKRLDELINAYLSDRIREDELRELEDCLATDRNARQRYLALSEHEIGIRDVMMGENALRQTASVEPGKPVRRIRMIVHASAMRRAAALAILIGGALAMFWAVHRATPLPFRFAITMAEDAVIERDGNVIPASTALNVLAGDRIRTGEKGRLTFGESTAEMRLALQSNTRIVVDDAKDGLALSIDQGRVMAVVATRTAAGKPLRLSSPHATAVVMGTRLGFSVEPALTRVTVSEGVVRFTRKSDGRTVDVRAGQYAVAAATEEQTDDLMQSVFLDPGPVVYSEDFEGDLEGWLYQRHDGPATAITPLSETELRRVRVDRSTVAGNDSGVLVLDATGSGRSYIGGGPRDSFIQNASSVIECDAFAFKEGARAEAGLDLGDVYRANLETEDEISFPTKEQLLVFDKWLRVRREYYLRSGEQGTTILEVRAYFDGVLYHHGRLVYSKVLPKELLFWARNLRCLVDNVVIRKAVAYEPVTWDL